VLGLDPASRSRLESAGVLKEPLSEEDEDFLRMING